MRHINTSDLRNGVVLSPHNVELELAFIVEQLEKGTALLVEVSERLATNETTLKVRMAQSIHRSKASSVDRRNAEALVVNEDLWSAVELDKARQRLVRDTQHDLRAELEAVRSIGASVRSSMWEQGSGASGRQQEPQGRHVDGVGR